MPCKWGGGPRINILIQEKQSLSEKIMTRDKEVYYIMIKNSSQILKKSKKKDEEVNRSRKYTIVNICMHQI